MQIVCLRNSAGVKECEILAFPLVLSKKLEVGPLYLVSHFTPLDILCAGLQVDLRHWNADFDILAYE